MKYNRRESITESGVSLIELLVVISIIGIISTIAIVSFGSATSITRRQTVARELKVAFERARFDSVKRRAQDSAEQAKVEINQNSFKLTTDVNQNGVLETNEIRTNTSWNTSISIRSQNGATLTSPPITILFNKRGEPVTSAGATATAVFLVCNGTCSTLNSSNSNLVLVTPTGTVNILPGGTSIPTFAAPGVTSIPTGTDILPETKIN
jgi:prepilin-type N-terminal cleavage/methylation domain-containing protein